jgi:hypothetical protein
MTKHIPWWMGALLPLAVIVTACGGGTKESATVNDTTRDRYTLTAEIKRGDAITTTAYKGETLQFASRVTRITETLRNGAVISSTSVPAANEIVRFSAGGGTLTPDSATTNAQGEATVAYRVGEIAGAYRLTATLDRPGTTATPATANFAIADAVRPRITLTLTDAQGAPTGTMNARGTLQVRALAERVQGQGGDAANVPAVGVRLKFASEAGVFEPASAEAVTDGQGRAALTFRAGTRGGTFTLAATATIDGQLTTGIQTVEIRAPDIVLGSGTPFVEGALGIELSSIGAGGQTAISVALFDRDAQQLALEPATISFTSTCVDAGTASIDSPVIANDGRATTLYQAGAGCQGSDLVTASYVPPGSAVARTAQGTVQVAAPTAGKLEFVSAVPTAIALRGFSSVERPDISLVTFRVRSATDIPVASRQVTFSLTNTAGGIELLQPSSLTNAAGEVVARVRAGNVPATVRVVASVPGTALTTQSGAIVIANSSPDQNSFSLSASTLNPEAFNFDGVTAELTIRVGDAANNASPDGTRVLFGTEGGVIDSSCETTNGVCSVTWTSSNPRPVDGRVTIFARTVGDESFIDADGDGLYDIGEAFDDLGEAFRDDDEDRVYDVGEPFGDLNQDGIRNGPNGLFDGAACVTGCGATRSVEIREDIVLVMATSALNLSITPSSVSVNQSTTVPVRVLIADLNGNLPPAGTSIAITTTNGVLSGTTTFVVPESNARGPIVVTVLVTGDATASSGALTVTATTPAGVVTTASIPVNDTNACSEFSPPPPGCPTGKAGGAQVASLHLVPERVALDAPGQGRVVIQAHTTGELGQTVTGAMPDVVCSFAGSEGLEAAPIVPKPLDAQGRTQITLQLARAAGAEGAGACDVTVLGRTQRIEVH